MTEAQPWSVEIIDGAGEKRAVALSVHQYLIGRSSEARIVLERNTVSRRHARLSRDISGWLIEDSGSRGGVVVDRVRIDKPTRLRHGSRIGISRFDLILIDAEAEALASSLAIGSLALSWLEADTGANISALTDASSPQLDSSHIVKLDD